MTAIERLGVLTGLYERRREALAREAGLTVEQWSVLEEIETEHFMPSMFARRRSSSAAAVSKILRQLLDAGLIAVAIGTGDRRCRAYSTTAKGSEKLSRVRAERRRAINAIWRGFPAQQLRTFSRFAAALSRRIEDYEISARVRRKVSRVDSGIRRPQT